MGETSSNCGHGQQQKMMMKMTTKKMHICDIHNIPTFSFSIQEFKKSRSQGRNLVFFFRFLSKHFSKVIVSLFKAQALFDSNIIMQTQLKFQYQYSVNDVQAWKPFKYVLPENPSDAYKVHGQQEYNLKSTEKCPFPRIRQLLIAISQTQETNLDLDLPDLLRQKYYNSPQDGEVDKQLNLFISRGEDASYKLAEILECLNHYTELCARMRDSLESETSRRIRQIEEKVEQNKIRIRETEENIKMKGKPRREANSFMGSMSGERDSSIQQQNINASSDRDELKRLENQRIQIYKQNEQDYKKTNEYLLEIQNSYFTFVNYSEQLQRALTTASVFQLRSSREEKIENSKASKIDDASEVEGKITKLNRSLDDKIKTGIQGLFRWREKVKSSRPSQRDKEEMQKVQTSIKEELIKADNVFFLLNQMDEIFQKDKRSYKKAFNKANQMYRDFLPGYIEAKEVNEINLRRKEYLGAIKEEKMKLKRHLQENLGLIVPYSQSEEYEKLIRPLKEKKERENKNYLDLLFKDEMEALKIGIEFINEQYEKLYKMACNRESSAKRNIQKWVEKFKEYEVKGRDRNEEEFSEENSFFILLEESCRKLMWMLK